MTVAQAIREAAEELSATSDTARLDAELLMAHALATSRSAMLLQQMDREPPGDYRALIDRRRAREPVAYITGSQEFFGREFHVNSHTLIPRGDSELIVDLSMEVGSRCKRFLDLGTGSGALLLSVLAELGEAGGIGIDKSQGAIDVARDNAQRLGIASDKVRFLKRSWLDQDWASDLGSFDCILCNPPYVEEGAELDPDVRDYEPRSALFAGIDGLDDYRVLIPQLRALMSDGGLALIEIGATQSNQVSEIARMEGFAVSVHCDLAKRPRCLALR